MGQRALIYTRISKDDADDRLGVKRQERLCRELAERRGLDVARVIVDNDMSAYKGRQRPGFEAVVKALQTGEASAVIAYHVDRLYRRMGDLERLVDLVEETGAHVHTVAAGDVDLSTASGRMVARMLGAAAQHESERIGERMRAKHDELAARGRPPGGRPPYGYRWERHPDGSTHYVVADSEAEAVRFMARRVIEGASLLSVSKELDAAGIKTREGRPWHHSTVRSVLVNPAVAGLRVHRRERRTDGERSRVALVAGPGDWQPVLDRPTWEQARATLQDPARKRTRPARRHMLTGLVENELGERMNGSVNNQGEPVYTTRMPAQQSRQIGAEALEDFVSKAVLIRTDAAVVPVEQPRADGGAGGAVVELEAELAELAELRGSGEISLAEWMAARKPLQARLDEARKAAGAPLRIPDRIATLLAQPGALRAAWGDLGVEEKRTVVRQVVNRVIIGPASRGRWTPLKDRVDFDWRV